jgi:hypothetical protein
MEEQQQTAAVTGRLPKRIDFESGTFTANGNTYTIEQGLSIERYAELQILEKELAYGFTVKAIFERLQKIWNQLNKLHFAEIAVTLRDLMAGVKQVSERQPVVLKICALFINTPDEDRTTISKDLIDRKTADWKAEGMDMRDFFQVASSSVNGFLEVYEAVTRIISAQEGTKTAENQ